VMRRFEKQIPTLSEGGQATIAQTFDQLRGDLYIGCVGDYEWQPRLLELLAEGKYGFFNTLNRIVEQARVNVRCARGHLDTILYGNLRHSKSGLQIRSTVIDARQHMAMQVYQLR